MRRADLLADRVIQPTPGIGIRRRLGTRSSVGIDRSDTAVRDARSDLANVDAGR